MQTLNILLGVSTIGNTVNVDKNINELDTTGLISMKTLNNNVWSSWTPGTPEMFQGFLDIKRGVGYVTNASVAKEIVLDGPPLNINNMVYSPGLSMIAIPFDNRVIGDGYIPRLKLASMKTIDVGVWKSWTSGAPEMFQGFTTINKNVGYVVNVDEVYNSYINNNIQNLLEGVRFNIKDVNINDGVVINGVRYTNPNNLGTFSFSSTTFDPTIPTAIMFFSIDNKIAKIDFPIELLGDDFSVSYNSDIYIGTFIENESYANPTIINISNNEAVLDLTYDKIENIDGSNTTYNKMILILDDVRYVIEFANEYLGNTFNIWKDGKIINNTFTIGEVTVNM